jgi:linoleoyl-CoA desaturase
MKTVRFENKGNRNFATALRKNINGFFKDKELSTKGDWRMMVKTAVMLSIYLAPFFMLLLFPLSAWMIFPLAVVAGLGMAGTGMSVMHDAAHDSFSHRRWLNKLLSGTMYLIGGNVFTWKVQHNVLHHTYTNIAGYDEDIKTKTVIRLSKHAPLRKFHRFQHIYGPFFYSLMTLSKLFGDFRQLWIYNKTGITVKQNSKPTSEFIKLIVTKAAYLVLAIGLILFFTNHSWWIVLLGFLVMHLTAGFILSVIFQMAHIVEDAHQPVPDEHGTVENEWAIHELNTTVNFSTGNRFLTWVTGGLNYQIEHHLFPNICHMHYRKISPIVERTAIEFGLNYNRNATFISAIRSHIRTLKMLGR